jgi:hypothetical protein
VTIARWRGDNLPQRNYDGLDVAAIAAAISWRRSAIDDLFGDPVSGIRSGHNSASASETSFVMRSITVIGRPEGPAIGRQS